MTTKQGEGVLVTRDLFAFAIREEKGNLSHWRKEMGEHSKCTS